MYGESEDSSKSKIIPSKCKICGASALYKYFGVISCHACKIFFKRNAQKGLESIRCDLNGDCQINIDNRHICTFCRLKKCFNSGMQIELIRCSRQGNKKSSRTTNRFNDSFENSNLLHTNKYAQLSIDQRIILRKLNQLYDDYQIFTHVENFVQKQNSLPIKLRLKLSSFNGLFQTIFTGINLFFKLNNSYFSSYSDNLTNLIDYIMENAGHLTFAFIQSEIPLIDQTESLLYQFIDYLPNQITNDRIFLQLGIIIFLFSTKTNSQNDRISFKEIYFIENIFTEITWKYLISKYNFNQAVIYFIHLIKSFILLEHTIRNIHQSEEQQHFMKTLLQQILIDH